MVFVCENNLYGLTCSTKFSLPIEDIADRASGYGMPGVVVDGMDVRAIYATTKQAVELARSGGGPSLIECKTYRYEGHWLADPVLYRTEEELEAWKNRHPIEWYKKTLTEEGVMTESEIDQIEAQVKEEVAASAVFAKAGTHPSVDTVSDYTYA